MNRWELEQKIVLKALKDPAFKKKLLSQPSEAVREVLKNEKLVDFSWLDKITVRVLEENRNEWVLAIPRLSEEVSHLTDQVLGKLAGGPAIVVASFDVVSCQWHPPG